MKFRTLYKIILLLSAYTMWIAVGYGIADNGFNPALTVCASINTVGWAYLITLED